MKEDLFDKNYKEIRKTALIYTRQNLAKYNKYIRKNLENDVMQDAIIHLYNKTSNYNPEMDVKFVTWYSKVLKNAVIDSIRKYTRNIEILDEELYLEKEYIEKTSNEGVFDELSKILKDNEIEILRYKIDGYTHQEISKILPLTKKEIDKTIVSLKRSCFSYWNDKDKRCLNDKGRTIKSLLNVI